ncbi:unnamed protein product [Soboliphyme baturini]|uniref:Uncharacterized protein n=1 Tax=Soboliphyme baturini TaxID=241478 RepID=A0A183IC25_9BILA|nr:unnamed protein product [Soboliphyme baturini]
MVLLAFVYDGRDEGSFPFTRAVIVTKRTPGHFGCYFLQPQQMTPKRRDLFILRCPYLLSDVVANVSALVSRSRLPHLEAHSPCHYLKVTLAQRAGPMPLHSVELDTVPRGQK